MYKYIMNSLLWMTVRDYKIGNLQYNPAYTGCLLCHYQSQLLLILLR